VPAAVIHQLPVPVPPRDSGVFASIVRLSRAAAERPGEAPIRAELQARVTLAYGLDDRDLVHVLGTFPLVPEVEREDALAAFRRVRDEL
jgi:hypothetical protein